MLYRILRLARKANTLRNSLIAYGVFTYLLFKHWHILLSTNPLSLQILQLYSGIKLEGLTLYDFNKFMIAIFVCFISAR